MTIPEYSDRRTHVPEFREWQGETLLRVAHGPLPFGWKWHDELPGWCRKDPEAQEAIAKARQFVANGCTYTDTANWLARETGRSLSLMGLKYVLRRGY